MRFKNKAKNKKYRSGTEERFAKYLRKNNLHFDYESRFFEYNEHRVKKYIPDFELDDFFVEFKGRFTAADRKKMLAMKTQHPTLDIRLVFEKDNWLTKMHTSRYSDWAKKHGFKYHVGISLPQEWIKELK